jgi:hypothetical protein
VVELRKLALQLGYQPGSLIHVVAGRGRAGCECSLHAWGLHWCQWQGISRSDTAGADGGRIMLSFDVNVKFCTNLQRG